MNSKFPLPSISLLNLTIKKNLHINYWQVAMTAILILTFAGYVLSMLNGTAMLVLAAAIIFFLCMKPVYDILNADYNINLENLDM